jgi:hypothetical protein
MNSSIHRIALLLALTTGGVLALAGCVKPPIEGRLDPYPASQIHFASKDLRDHTAVGTPNATRDDSGNILYITVPVRAATDRELHVDYRVTFLNKNGQPLNQTGWFTRTLAPNVPDYITVNSLGSRAADFQMDFRYAQ